MQAGSLPAPFTRILPMRSRGPACLGTRSNCHPSGSSAALARTQLQRLAVAGEQRRKGGEHAAKLRTSVQRKSPLGPALAQDPDFAAVDVRALAIGRRDDA